MLQTARSHSLFVLSLALLPFVAAPSSAQPTAANSEKLPVKAVTLFSSGVSFTLREGQVNGDATIALTFRTNQINDILKSLVLLDDKGTVQPVVYGAKDPISRTLQSFAVDVTQPLTRSALLNQLRGRVVEVETMMQRGNNTSTETITGQIIGVEARTVVVEGNRAANLEYLNLLTDQGLKSIPLESVSTIRFKEERLNQEFREALSLLAAGADDRRRQVTVQFSGDSQRRVRVGYVSEAPLWKITYRLLLGDGVEKPYLQGWALVENTSEEDWVNVRLSLVSGRPISFLQDLYQPLYLPRPVVPLDIVASPYPQIAEGVLEAKNAPEPLAIAPPAAMADIAAKPRAAGRILGGAGGAGAHLESLATESAPGTTLTPADMIGVQAQASGQKTGELFQYNITTPVTLPRQQAAMIPVLAQDIAGQKLSLYNADIDPRYPLNAFRLKNSSSLHLKGGAVTVFDGGIYAGDARMEDIPPGDSRLITYAVDLAVEGERQSGEHVTRETALSIKRGVLTISRKERQEVKYTLKNKAMTSRVVLVEHPFDPEYTLITPKEPTERTRSHYRFEVTVPASKTGSLAVVLERVAGEQLAILNGDLTQLEYYIKSKEAPQKLKTALQEVVTRRRRVQELQSRLAEAEAEIKSLNEDQERVRRNMSSLDRNSELYKRYLKQLDEQETRIQSLRMEVTRLRSQITETENALRAYIDTIEI